MRNKTSLKLLDDEVEVVPAVVGEEARVEAQRDLGVVLLRALPGEVLRLAWEMWDDFETNLK